MTVPRYSFIIISRNTVELTCAAVASIERFAAGVPHEIILVDNGSTDQTLPRLRRDHSSVEVIELQENRGFAAANNIGAKSASGEWLILMNSDAELFPETMADLERVLGDHPEVGVLGGQLLNPDRTFQTSLLLEKAIPNFESMNQDVDVMEVRGIVGAFMVVRRSWWDKLGGMDESFFFYFEETDFCRRAAQAGAKVCWSPRFRVLHHGGGSVGGASPKARVEFYRSLYNCWAKEMPADAFRQRRNQMAMKIAFNSAGNLATCLLSGFLVPTPRRRLRIYLRLLMWHFFGCPEGWGLRPESSVKPRDPAPVDV